MKDINDLEQWFQERPKWLQDAATRLVQKGNVVEQDVDELINICNKEAAGQAVTFSSIPSGSLVVQDPTRPIHLETIGEVQGVNALDPSKPLEFGETPLCIIYGRNGSGKSGYARLLKHACGARHSGTLLGNVFDDPKDKAAKLTFSDDGTDPKTANWHGNPLPELRGIEIYDTACGHLYVNEENEVTFEPWILRLFTQLTEICAFVSQRLKKQIEDRVSRKPALPEEFTSTLTGQWYLNLSFNVSKETVAAYTAWDEANENALTGLNKRLGEINPATKAIALRRQRTVILELEDALRKSSDSLSDDRCRVYLDKKLDAIRKRKAADEDASKVFSGAPLSAVGSGTWRAMWELARKYSEEYVYLAKEFPVVESDSRCVLCQQQMDPDTKKRMTSFEAFVKSEMQSLAAEAEKILQEAETLFINIPNKNELELKMEAAGIVDDVLKKVVTDFSSILQNRKSTLMEAASMEKIVPLPSLDIFDLLEELANDLQKQANACDEDAKGDNRAKLEKERDDLLAKKWMSQQRAAIDEEILRLKEVDLLEKSERLTNTAALSKKKSSLADQLITDAYIDRFKNELKQLKASHISVELKKTRAEVGRVYHQIFIRGAKTLVRTADVLSEGEFRIVSLAAFLADTAGREAKMPFIFDDPVSSLDQVYEDALASCLASLSKVRQVIVFTHRLSLVGLLEKYAGKIGIDPGVICLSRFKIGDVSDSPIVSTKTKQTANRLLNDRMKKLRASVGAGDQDYEKEARALCADIRNLIEQIIESDLLMGIVRRHSAEVQTKGKIGGLAKITEKDCVYIDGLMTKYSNYEHSQSDEAPVDLPKPDDIEADLKNILGFIEDIKKRRGG